MSEPLVVPRHRRASGRKLGRASGVGDVPGTSRTRRSLRSLAVGAAVILLSAAWVVVTKTRPSFDAFGWLVWGKEVVLHGRLNLDGAPSWKPLTFLFTVPYALLGRAQLPVWALTATAGAIGCSLFAGRIAYRLAGPSPERHWPALGGAVFAAVALAGINGWSHLVLIANSDPLEVMLCLVAIDAHLCRRPRLAFVAVVLAAFGRPEVWLFAGLYGAWTWRTVPSARLLVAAGIVAIPLAWFIAPALASKSWLSAGNLALNSPHALHGDKITGEFGRFLSLYELPMKLAVGLTMLYAVLRRQRALLVLSGLMLLWILVEIAFAYHGWSGVARYLIEPGAVAVVLAGVGVGRLLARSAERSDWLRWAGFAAVLALLVGLAPAARQRARLLHGEIDQAKLVATELGRLQTVVDRSGGPALIKSCGQPLAKLAYQSTLAWYVDLNVGNVAFNPGRQIASGRPEVLFKQYAKGWQIRPVNTRPADTARCARLRIDSATG